MNYLIIIEVIARDTTQLMDLFRLILIHEENLNLYRNNVIMTVFLIVRKDYGPLFK